MSRLSVLSVVALAALMASVSALTVEIQPHESSCFFQDATKVGQRMHFSFAVRPPFFRASLLTAATVGSIWRLFRH